MIDDDMLRAIYKGMKLDRQYRISPNSAHISVFDKNEVANMLPDEIEEEGDEFVFTLGDVVSVNPENWEDVDECIIVQVFSEEIMQLRLKYGLSPKMNENKHEFHITIAIK